MNTKKTVQRFLLVALFLVLPSLIIGPFSQTSAQDVPQSYASDQKLQTGMIVKLKKDDPSKVEVVDRESAKDSYGIIVNANDSPFSLTQEGRNYYVASSGIYDILVSNENDAVRKGDLITFSSIGGIGMRAGTRDEYIVATAADDFDGSKNLLSNQRLKDQNGKETEVKVGKVKADVRLLKNPNFSSDDPPLIKLLRKIAPAIVGKQISVIRAGISLGLFFITLILFIVIIYAGVRGSVVSIGRNPLGKKAITLNLLKVIAIGLAVFMVGLFGVYLILRL